MAVSFHIVDFDSFHLSATLTACDGGASSSVSDAVLISGVSRYSPDSLDGGDDGLAAGLPLEKAIV